jgi:hypothetical protein
VKRDDGDEVLVYWLADSGRSLVRRDSLVLEEDAR